MLRRTDHLGLSRRVVAYYLVFSWAAVTWLVVGLVVVIQSVWQWQAETTCLNRVGEAARAVRSAMGRSEAGLQGLVEEFADRWRLRYCALVSAEGRYVAHSDPPWIGRRYVVPVGQTACWGEVQRVRHVDPDGKAVAQYEVPIVREGQTRGTLILGVPERGVWGVVWAAAERAPAAFFLPLIFMTVGILALKRTVRPLAPIEEQLAGLATRVSVSEGDLKPVRLPHPVAVGWNRLVEAVTGEGRGERSSRMAQALEGYRQKKSDQILNSLADGVAVTDEDGRIKFANKAMLGLSGQRARDGSLAGRSVFDCLGLESAGAAVQPLRDPAQASRQVVVEFQRSEQIEDGVFRIARTPLQAERRGTPQGHLWCVRDITQQKLADRMREQFVNAATHELRTPLANIKAYSETLALGDLVDVEQQKAFCNTIDEEVTRLAHFVDDLLHLSRMQVGSTCLNRQVTDMERLLREVQGKVRQQMSQKNITFDVNLPGKLPEMVVDKEKLTVAVINLLGNAAKYTPEGGRVQLNVEIREGDGSLAIHVEDTGIGIAPDELPKVCERFFRSADSRVLQINGSGLGLALTQEVVRLHGGKLHIESELNKGSTFSVILPIQTAEAPCSNG